MDGPPGAAGRSNIKALAGTCVLTRAFRLERVTGIEPALSAWEAEVLPLNYTRAATPGRCARPDHTQPRRYVEHASRTPRAHGVCGYRGPVLLSDRDIRAELDAWRVVLEPYEPEMIQPSSIDVRLDRLFRLFDNHKYSFIDP